jgi:hypothetical protein
MRRRCRRFIIFLGLLFPPLPGPTSPAQLEESPTVEWDTLLAHHFGQVFLMLDGDEAGRAATEEIADRLQRRILHVKTIELDDGVQPDQLISEQLRAELGAVVG